MITRSGGTRQADLEDRDLASALVTAVASAACAAAIATIVLWRLVGPGLDLVSGVAAVAGAALVPVLVRAVIQRRCRAASADPVAAPARSDV
jgi:hypothetical protein